MADVPKPTSSSDLSTDDDEWTRLDALDLLAAANGQPAAVAAVAAVAEPTTKTKPTDVGSSTATAVPKTPQPPTMPVDSTVQFTAAVTATSDATKPMSARSAAYVRQLIAGLNSRYSQLAESFENANITGSRLLRHDDPERDSLIDKSGLEPYQASRIRKFIASLAAVADPSPPPFRIDSTVPAPSLPSSSSSSSLPPATVPPPLPPLPARLRDQLLIPAPQFPPAPPVQDPVGAWSWPCRYCQAVPTSSINFDMSNWTSTTGGLLKLLKCHLANECMAIRTSKVPVDQPETEAKSDQRRQFEADLTALRSKMKAKAASASASSSSSSVPSTSASSSSIYGVNAIYGIGPHLDRWNQLANDTTALSGAVIRAVGPPPPVSVRPRTDSVNRSDDKEPGVPLPPPFVDVGKPAATRPPSITLPAFVGSLPTMLPTMPTMADLKYPSPPVPMQPPVSMHLPVSVQPPVSTPAARSSSDAKSSAVTLECPLCHYRDVDAGRLQAHCRTCNGPPVAATRCPLCNFAEADTVRLAKHCAVCLGAPASKAAKASAAASSSSAAGCCAGTNWTPKRF